MGSSRPVGCTLHKAKRSFLLSLIKLQLGWQPELLPELLKECRINILPAPHKHASGQSLHAMHISQDVASHVQRLMLVRAAQIRSGLICHGRTPQGAYPDEGCWTWHACGYSMHMGSTWQSAAAQPVSAPLCRLHCGHADTPAALPEWLAVTRPAPSRAGSGGEASATLKLLRSPEMRAVRSLQTALATPLTGRRCRPAALAPSPPAGS